MGPNWSHLKDYLVASSMCPSSHDFDYMSGYGQNKGMVVLNESSSYGLLHVSNFHW